VERVLEAAESAFGADGYAGTRLADVARAAGIRRPSLLYHFSTKQVLYGAVVDRLFESLMTSLATAIEDVGDYDARVPALMDALIDFIEARPAFSPIVLREMVDGTGPGRELLIEVVVPVLDQVEEWLNHAAGKRAPEGFDFRGAIVQMTINAMVRAASGPLREPIWGRPTDRTLLRRLFFLDRT